MGHDNVRAAMIYQHAVRGAGEAITNAVDRRLEARDDRKATASVTGHRRPLSERTKR
ncbi:hypothetical protein [Nonomuraea sp. NPDC049684]|uniref:hypothetical protein n=1 Tax=unclassified Nonomuraea TaxID=2593643 RepID=UPI0037A963A9